MVARLANFGCFESCTGILPTPDRGPNPHFLEKNPPFPLALTICKGWKRELSVPKIPIFYVYPCRKRGSFGPKTPFSRMRGNGVFWTPKPSFPRTWGFGPLSGVGGICFDSCTRAAEPKSELLRFWRRRPKTLESIELSVPKTLRFENTETLRFLFRGPKNR